MVILQSSHDPASPGGNTVSPTIGRYVERFPEIESAVTLVLERAAIVREARTSALPERGLPSPPRTEEWQELHSTFVESIRALERLAEENPSRDQVMTGVRRVLLASMRLRIGSYGYSPSRKTTSPEARARLFGALRSFKNAYAALEEMVRNAHMPEPPRQLRYSPNTAPETPVRKLELTAFDLPLTPASEEAWGERCSVSGSVFLTDSNASPELRYRSLESCGTTLSPEVFGWFQRFRLVLDRLRTWCPEAVGEAVRLLPNLWEDYLPEQVHPTFEKLGLRDFPSLAVSLNNYLRVFAQRPFLGFRGESGGFRALGVADRSEVALAEKGAVGSGYTWDSFDQVRDQALRLAYGLENLGLRPGMRIGILTRENCKEFYIVDFASVFGQLVTVGFQETLGDEHLAGVMQQAQLSAIVGDNDSINRILSAGLIRKCPDLVTLVAFGKPIEVPSETAGGVGVARWEEVLGNAEEAYEDWISPSGVGFSTDVIYGDQAGWMSAEDQGIPVDEDDAVFTIIFTSGSTGRPKGTIVTRRRWIEEFCYRVDVWPYVGVSFQPSAVGADRIGVWQAAVNGGRIGFARRGVELFEDVRAIRPTLLEAPPAVWNVIQTEYLSEVGNPHLDRRELVSVRRRFRDCLGGRLGAIGIGGAQSDEATRRTMETIFGIPMSEGYGATETGRIASRGQILPNVDFFLVDIPGLGFTSSDKPYPRGELAVKTARTTAQYFNDEASSREGFTDDGYFLTGDIVEIGPSRRCRILGRRKEFFKLAGAEFVSPALLEDVYMTSPLVEAVFITGLPTQAAVVAVVVPAESGVSEKKILAELRALGKDSGLRPFELPAGVVVEPVVEGDMPWTAENGLRTPSMKLRRRALASKYGTQIEKAYSKDGRGAPATGGDDRSSRETSQRLVAATVGSILALDPGEIDMEKTFEQNGGDSLTAMSFLLRMEQMLVGTPRGPGPRGDDLKDLVGRPLNDLAERVRTCGGNAVGLSEKDLPSRSWNGATRASQAPQGNQRDRVALRFLADSKRSISVDQFPEPATSGNVLLTGANGFLGVHVLREVASSLLPGSRIFALVRASDDRAALARLAGALADASVETERLSTRGDRELSPIVVLSGAVDTPRLGLSEEVYRMLESEIGVIYHLAAVVNLSGDYDDLQAPNVEGTCRILDLATSVTSKALHFVSSMDVASVLEARGVSPVFEESPLGEDLSPSVIPQISAYALTKWVGERILANAYRDSGRILRLSISRPALITWAGNTGFVHQSDWFARMIASCLLTRSVIGPGEVGVLQWVPQTAASALGLDLVPVDFCARAIQRIGEQTRGATLPSVTRVQHGVQGPTFHVSNIVPAEAGLVPGNRFLDMLVAADLRLHSTRPPMEYVSLNEWRMRVEEMDAPMMPFLPYLPQLLRMRPRAECARFAAAISGRDGRTQIPGPQIDQAYVDAHIARLLGDLSIFE